MKPKIVITLKLKSGEDLIGYYLGEEEESDINQKSVCIYRPIKIKQIHFTVDGYTSNGFNYASDLYSLYGSPMVLIPYSNILTRDVASPFFEIYYERSMGELLALEDKIQDNYIKAYQKQDLREVMKNTDSIYVEQETEHLQ